MSWTLKTLSISLLCTTRDASTVCDELRASDECVCWGLRFFSLHGIIDNRWHHILSSPFSVEHVFFSRFLCEKMVAGRSNLPRNCVVCCEWKVPSRKEIRQKKLEKIPNEKRHKNVANFITDGEPQLQDEKKNAQRKAENYKWNCFSFINFCEPSSFASSQKC